MEDRHDTPTLATLKVICEQLKDLKEDYKNHKIGSDIYRTKVIDTEKDIIRLKENSEHIRDRIDNGMSVTMQNMLREVQSINRKLAEDICPKVHNNTDFIDGVKTLGIPNKCLDNMYWTDKIKQAFYWIAVTGIGGGLIGFTFWLVKQ
jgi:hypothetical protein